MNTNLTPVESSQIAAIGYEEKTTTLTVQFNNASVYEYTNVPADLHAKLMAAESIGKFFNSNIKNNPDQFRYEKVR